MSLDEWLAFSASAFANAMLNSDYSFVYVETGCYGAVVVATCLFHKRSLLVSCSSKHVAISSACVGNSNIIFEVPQDSWLVFTLHSQTQHVTGLKEYTSVSGCKPSTLRFLPDALLKENELAASFDEKSFLSQLKLQLHQAVKLRVESIPSILNFKPGEPTPSVQVLFSGGIDSTILAALLCEVLDPSISLDLVNVSFDPDRSPDRISSLFAIADLKTRFHDRNLNLWFCDFEITAVLAEHEAQVMQLIHPK